MPRPPRTTTHIEILKRISDGKYPSQIAEEIGITKQNMNYYIQSFKNKGYIELDVRDVADFYNLTPMGVKYLGKLLIAQLDSGKSKVKVIPEGVRETFTSSADLPKFDNLHNLQFKAQIRKDVELWFPNTKQMKSWLSKYDWFGKIYVEKTTRNLIFRMAVTATNEWEALAKGYQAIFRLTDLLESTYGLELGHPISTRKPHYTIVGDKVAEAISDHMNVYVPDVGHIDKSKDRGELELYTAEDIGTYIRQSRTIKEIREHQMTQQGQLNEVIELLDHLVDEKKKIDPFKPMQDEGEMFR